MPTHKVNMNILIFFFKSLVGKTTCATEFCMTKQIPLQNDSLRNNEHTFVMQGW